MVPQPHPSIHTGVIKKRKGVSFFMPLACTQFCMKQLQMWLSMRNYEHHFQGGYLYTVFGALQTQESILVMATICIYVALPSAKRKQFEVSESPKVGELKRLAQKWFGHGFLKLVTAEGKILSEPEKSLRTAGLQDEDYLSPRRSSVFGLFG